jgi:long-chain fatty acid transport protein
VILDKLGSKSGSGFGFRDQWYYRVGAEWRWNDCWSFRAGYRYARALPRKSQTAVNALDCDCVQEFLTLGATYTYNCQIELSALYAYGFKHKVHGKNSIPPGPPPGGLGGGEADLTEQKYALALALGYLF